MSKQRDIRRLNAMSAAQAQIGPKLNRIQFQQNRSVEPVNNYQSLTGVQADTAKTITIQAPQAHVDVHTTPPS
ncbi:MAG: hypothetical protein K6T83_01735 [Alicyclobacillus sp.]|nr:hypothetical protein [Alicyclobacillus sp.]